MNVCSALIFQASLPHGKRCGRRFRRQLQYSNVIATGRVQSAVAHIDPELIPCTWCARNGSGSPRTGAPCGEAELPRGQLALLFPCGLFPDERTRIAHANEADDSASGSGAVECSVARNANALPRTFRFSPFSID